jgi:hypothetical protein
VPCLFRRALSSRCGTGQGDRIAGYPGCGRQLPWTMPRDLNKSLGCVAWLVARWRGCALAKTLARRKLHLRRVAVNQQKPESVENSGRLITASCRERSPCPPALDAAACCRVPGDGVLDRPFGVFALVQGFQFHRPLMRFVGCDCLLAFYELLPLRHRSHQLPMTGVCGDCGSLGWLT